ncbi:MAG: PqqD family protein, partial [Clostridia bacterium]|nr:PqqD family protein [Clostridia bacterium]
VGEAAQQMHGMIKLNATADAIWDLLSAGRTEDEIVAALTGQFNVPADVLREDVRAFIGRLRDLHILTD